MFQSEEIEEQSKIVVLGARQSGRSSVIWRFSDETFINSYIPLYKTRTLCFHNFLDFPELWVCIKMVIWKGRRDDYLYTFNAFDGFDAIMFVVALTESDDKINQDITGMFRNYTHYAQSYTSLIFIGNKQDLTEISVEDSQARLKRLVQNATQSESYPSFVVSAKSGLNINEPFNFIAQKRVNRIRNTAQLTRLNANSHVQMAARMLRTQSLSRLAPQTPEQRQRSQSVSPTLFPNSWLGPPPPYSAQAPNSTHPLRQERRWRTPGDCIIS